MRIPQGADDGRAGKRFQSAAEASPQTKANKPQGETDPAPPQDVFQASPVPSLRAEKGQDSTTTQPGHINFLSTISAATAQFFWISITLWKLEMPLFTLSFSMPGFAFSHHLRCRDAAGVWLGFHQSGMGNPLKTCWFCFV